MTGANIDWEELIKKDQSASGPLDVRSFREKFAEMLNQSERLSRNDWSVKAGLYAARDR